MPVYRGVAENYTRPQSQKWVCDKTKCRYYKRNVMRERNKFTGCHKHVNTWQCPKFMAKDWYK
jgi:hypothetical protein